MMFLQLNLKRFPVSFLIITLVVMVLGISGSKLIMAQEENLSVLERWLKYTDSANSLYHHLSSQAFEYLDQRAIAVARLTTKEQWQQRQETVRKTLQNIVGPFPEKTPLNARILGTIAKTNYHVDKIIFEAQPQFYVTACLFIPDNLKGKTPAIIYCSGHSAEGFRSATYQKIILNLVKKGFIVFAFDPVGQGERLQYLDPETGKSRIGGPTLEHSYPGAQCFLIGSSQARYMIWDGIRAIDYLLTRTEVDPARIGITGRSGGGTQSVYIAAFDDRILATAPECYITNFRRLFESIGPQDAEQNFYHGIASSIDHPDLLEVRAPKPALMITTTRDFFSIQGARETANEVKKAYQAFGQEDNFAMAEDDSGHASTRKNREAMIAFFQKHLQLPGKPDDDDEEVEILSPEELQITHTGQVVTSLGGETVFSLNKREAQHLIKTLEKSRHNEGHLELVRNAAAKLSGFIKPGAENQAVFTGRHQRGTYVIEKYFIQGEGEYVIPFLLMLPANPGRHPAIIYLHPESKAAQAAPGAEMEWLVKQGYAVLAPDLVMTGEMGPGSFKGDAYNFIPGKAFYNTWFAAIQIARSIVGIQAGDVVRVVNFLENRQDIDTDRISGAARGDMCLVILYAAVFDNRISQVALIEPLVSYASLAMNLYYQPHFIPASVPGSLTAYDLPDLCAALAPRRLLLVNVMNQNGERVESELLAQELALVSKTFTKKGAGEAFDIRTWQQDQSMDEVFSTWIR